MLTSIFSDLLRKVDPNLFVDWGKFNYLVNNEQGTIPIYKLGKWLEISEYDKSVLDEDGKKLATRQKEYLAYIPAKHIPEYSKYNPQLVCIEPGWRDVLRRIHKAIPNLGGKIRRVFGLDLDWKNDWDLQSPAKRAERQGVVLKKQKTIEQLANTNYILDKDDIVEVPKN